MSDFDFPGTERFEIVRKLGEGAMGMVYEAFDREQHAHVALKTLRLTSPELLFRLKSEFRAVSDLQHPNLVSLGDLVEDQGHWFFTMELVEGPDILSYVRPIATGLDETRLRDALRQLAHGLEALHATGHIHRDIKPSNVRVTPGGRVVLLDFGLAIPRASHRRTPETNIVGSAAYMAPEQAASRPVEPAADWYSVGVVLYEALTGHLPFDGTPFEILLAKQEREPEPAARLAPRSAEDLTDLATALLHRDPTRRPTGRTLLRRLGARTVDGAIAHHITAQTPFVGRRPELAALWRAAEDARAGAAVTAYVHGPAGLGKSSLVHHFLDELHVEHPDAILLVGRCYQREAVPYKGLDGVVDGLADYLHEHPDEQIRELAGPHAAVLRRVFPTLGRVPAIARARATTATTSDPYELRRRAFAALRHLFTALAERGFLVVAIEDVHWADADSMTLLEELLAQPGGPTLLLVATSRLAPDERGASTARPKLPAYGELRRIELDALAPADARSLASAMFDTLGRARVTIDDVVREAHGHPLYLGELIRYSILDASPRGDAPQFDEMVRSRASSFAPAALRILEVACLAGAPLPPAVIRDAVGIDGSQLTEYLAKLRIAGLVRGGHTRADDGVEPYHDRIREAIVGSLQPSQQVALHLQIARALEGAGAPERYADLLLQHYRAAGKDRAAARNAGVAAVHAQAAFAFDRAADLYAIALELGNHEGERAAVLHMARGQALADSGRSPEAAAAFVAGARSIDPVKRLECQKRAAEQYLISGHIEQGLAALEHVLQEVGERLPRSPRRAFASLVFHRARLTVRGRHWKERHPSSISAHELALIDAYGAVAVGLGMVDPVSSADFQARGLLRSLKTGEKQRIGRALCYEAVSLSMPGGAGIDKGIRLADEARGIAESTGDPHLTGLVSAVEGMIAYFAGRFSEAFELMGRGEAKMREGERVAWGEINVGRTFRLFCLRLRGAINDMRALLGEYLREAERRGDRYSATTFRRTGYLVWLAADDDDRVRSELDRATWLPPEGRFHLQHYFGLMAESELRMYRGECEGLRELMGPGIDQLFRSLLARYVQITRTESHCLAGRLALAEHMTRPAPEALQVARRGAQRARAERTGYGLTWAALLQAGIDAAIGAEDDAVRSLREAAETADRLDMPLYGAVARFRLGPLLGGDEGAALRATADAWLASQGVRAPEKLMKLLAPGFA